MDGALVLQFELKINTSMPLSLKKKVCIFYRGIIIHIDSPEDLQNENRATVWPYRYVQKLTVCTADNDENTWTLLTEFIRACAYSNKFKFYIEEATRIFIKTPEKFNGGQIQGSDLKKIKVPRDIVKIDSEEKSNLLRLFSIANSSFDLYFKILFFLHVIIHPNEEVRDGISNIKDFLDKHPNIEDEFKQEIKNLRIRSNIGKIDNIYELGEEDTKEKPNYIVQLRHAISHFVRKDKDKEKELPHLKPDGYIEFRHLISITPILHRIARYRLDTYYNFTSVAGLDTFFACDIKSET